MSKESRDAEIERIVDIGVADENTRLANGGPGPGDFVGLERITDQEFEKVYRHDNPSATYGLDNELRDELRDEYREMIEAPAPEPELVLGTTHTPDRPAEILRVVDQIRGRVMSHEGQARTDVGYLLEVVDAYKDGRM